MCGFISFLQARPCAPRHNELRTRLSPRHSALLRRKPVFVVGATGTNTAGEELSALRHIGIGHKAVRCTGSRAVPLKLKSRCGRSLCHAGGTTTRMCLFQQSLDLASLDVAHAMGQRCCFPHALLRPVKDARFDLNHRSSPRRLPNRYDTDTTLSRQLLAYL